MSDSANSPIDRDDDLFDPPLVDSIYFDDQKGAFSITFVPSDDASTAMKESILISKSSPDYARVMTFWNRIQELTTAQSSIARIVHGGGGAYTFHFENGVAQELTATTDGKAAVEIADRL